MTNLLEGVAELEKKLENLKLKQQTAVLRAAVRAAMTPARDRAVELIPVGVDAHRTFKGRLVAPGFAKRSIRMVTKVEQGGAVVSAALGVRREAFYAVNFVELGTAKMPAHPWLRPALKTTQDQALAIFADKLKERIDKVTR